MTVIFDEEKQIKQLEEFKKKEEEDLAQIVAGRNGLEYADLGPIPINMDALRVIPEHIARETRVVGFSLIGKKIKVGVLSPNHPKLGEILTSLENQNYEVTQVVVSQNSLEKAWVRYADLSHSEQSKAGALEISSEEIKTFLSEIHSTEDVKRIVSDILKMKKGLRISKILEIILGGALATKASDIHIEPEETSTRLRYRLDGVLTDIIGLDVETYPLVLSRIKLLSGLKLNVKSEAQDGRFSIKLDSEEIEIRTSLLPGAYNESIVMRILNPKSIQVPLEAMGIPEKLLGILTHEIGRPKGLLLTTGPTGSGKTTTLYAFLSKVYDPGVKVLTIEDPIEYHLKGITQTQTNADKGYTFALGLRAALRQDPDVIMVGEIRDSETAETAVNAALTGHLVFSTLHTNSAAGTFPRLIDLGISPKTLISALNIALAQRLVRTLCSSCKTEDTPTDEERKIIEDSLNTIFDKTLIEGVNSKKIFRAKGCLICNGLGYKGRIGIYEAILADQTLEDVLIKNPSEREVRAATKHQGIPTLREDGILKVLKGLTSLDELGRVVDLETE
jgi:type IV pilus assembly protein PilB